MQLTSITVYLTIVVREAVELAAPTSTSTKAARGIKFLQIALSSSITYPVVCTLLLIYNSVSRLL
jgi:hypothetical protein